MGYFTIGLETKRPLEIDVQAFSSADQIADYQMALLIEVRNVTGNYYGMVKFTHVGKLRIHRKYLWDGIIFSCLQIKRRVIIWRWDANCSNVVITRDANWVGFVTHKLWKIEVLFQVLFLREILKVRVLLLKKKLIDWCLICNLK